MGLVLQRQTGGESAGMMPSPEIPASSPPQRESLRFVHAADLFPLTLHRRHRVEVTIKTSWAARRYLLVDPHCIQAVVHYVDPAVLRGQYKQGHERLEETHQRTV